MFNHSIKKGPKYLHFPDKIYVYLRDVKRRKFRVFKDADKTTEQAGVIFDLLQ